MGTGWTFKPVHTRATNRSLFYLKGRVMGADVLYTSFNFLDTSESNCDSYNSF